MAHPLALTVLLGKAGGLQESDLTLQVQVLLVATEDDHDVGASQCAGVCQPSSQRVISLPAVEKKKKREVVQERGRPDPTPSMSYTYLVMSYTSRAPAAPR